MEKIIVTACFVIASLIVTFFAYIQKAKAGNFVSNVSISAGVDTIPETSQTTSMENGVIINGNAIIYYGRGYKIVTNGSNDKITDAYYKGRHISDNEMSGHDDMMKKVIREQKEMFEKQAEKGTKKNASPADGSKPEQNANDSKVDPEDKVDSPTGKNGSDGYVSTRKDDSNRPGANTVDPAQAPYGYKITEGNTIRYFLRGYEIVTENGKKVIALYKDGKKIPDEQLSGYQQEALQMVNEVQEGINKRVMEWRKRRSN